MQASVRCVSGIGIHIHQQVVGVVVVVEERKLST